MADDDYDATETALRAAFETSGAGDPGLDLDSLRSRAHRELHLRNLVGFGFSHMVRAVLGLLGRLYGERYQPGTESR